MRDLDFVSEKYNHLDLPPEKRYILKYFDTDIQESFIGYYMVFGDIENFMDHTGIYCSDRWVAKMLKKFEKLVSVHKMAKQNADFTLLKKIEDGKYKLGGKNEKPD